CEDQPACRAKPATQSKQKGSLTMSPKTPRQNWPLSPAGSTASAELASPADGPASMPFAGSTTQPIRLTLNGRLFELHLEARVTLLDALREYAGLTGTK